MSSSNNMRPRTSILLLLLVVIVIGLDQASKMAIVNSIRRGAEIEVIPGFFNLTLTYNLGAAFGLFSGLSDSIRSWVLLATTLVAFGVVILYMRTEHGKSPLARTAFALIVGGAVGNLLDRVRLGMVVDFLDVFFGNYHWPAFNVADSCICIGVCLLVIAPSPKKKVDP